MKDKKKLGFAIATIAISTLLLTFDKISETVWLTVVSSATTYFLSGKKDNEEIYD